MKDIIVTTPKSQMKNAATEAEKCKQEGKGWYFRVFKHRPEHLEIDSKIFYVEDGYIRGFAPVYAITHEQGTQCTTTNKQWGPGTVVWMKADQWKWITPIPMKGFQNWRYFDSSNVEVVGGWLDPKPDEPNRK